MIMFYDLLTKGQTVTLCVINVRVVKRKYYAEYLVCKIAPSCDSYDNTKLCMHVFYALYPLYFILCIVFFALY